MNYGTHVLAHATGRGIFNYYASLEAAQADMTRANERVPDWGPYEPMTWDEYEAKNRAFWLTPAVRITLKQWDYAYEVLPPKNVESRPGFFSFLMMEHMSGEFTHQYVCRTAADGGKTYWEQMVDAFDRTTWMKP